MKRKKFNLKSSLTSLNPSLLGLLLLVSFTYFSFDAFAAGDNDAALKDMVGKAKDMFAGSFLQIALNFGGLAAIGYSIFSGFRPAPFIGGIGLLIFNALYFGYLNTYFA